MLFDRVKDLTYEDLLKAENIIDKVTNEANDNKDATADFSLLPVFICMTLVIYG